MFEKFYFAGRKTFRAIVKATVLSISVALTNLAFAQDVGEAPIIVEAQDADDAMASYLGVAAGPSSVIIIAPAGTTSINDADSKVKITRGGATLEEVVLNEEFPSVINQNGTRAAVILLDLALPSDQAAFVQLQQAEENLAPENLVTVRSFRMTSSGDLRASNSQQQTVENPNGTFSLTGMTESSLPFPMPLGGVVYDKCGNINALALPTSPNQPTSLFPIKSLVGVFGGNSVATPFPVSDQACEQNTGTSKKLELAEAALEEARREQEESAAEMAELREAAELGQQRLTQLEQNNARAEEIAAANEQLASILDQQTASADRQDQVDAQLAEALLVLEEAQKAAATAAEESGQTTQQLQIWKYVLYGLAALTVIIIGVLIWLAVRSRRLRKNLAAVEDEKRDIEEAKAAAEATWNDCVLENEEGFTVKLPGNKLVKSRGGVTIGRSREDADVVIDRDDVSRRHARIEADNDVVRITDLGSTNKTRVNGGALDQGVSRQLYEGDRIEFGTNAFTFKIIRR